MRRSSCASPSSSWTGPGGEPHSDVKRAMNRQVVRRAAGARPDRRPGWVGDLAGVTLAARRRLPGAMSTDTDPTLCRRLDRGERVTLRDHRSVTGGGLHRPSVAGSGRRGATWHQGRGDGPGVKDGGLFPNAWTVAVRVPAPVRRAFQVITMILALVGWASLPVGLGPGFGQPPVACTPPSPTRTGAGALVGT
jgi:hypothetical protein